MANFPEFDKWQAPWEKKGEELDPEIVKKLVYNLQKSEDDLTDKVKDKDTKLTEDEKALEAYREAEAAAKKAAETAEETAAREAAERTAASEKVTTDLKRANDLLTVRLEKGLTEAEAKRITGNTLEELLADADEFIKLVPRKEAEVEDEADQFDDQGNPLVRQPKVNAPLNNKSEPDDVDIVKHVREHSVHPLLG